MFTATEAVAQGRLARDAGNFAMARELYAQAAKVYSDQNDVLAYAHTIRHIADIYQQESNLVEAKPLYEVSLEIYRSNLGTKLLDLANAVRPYALLNEQQGDLHLARKLWVEAKQLYDSLRLEQGVSECDVHIGNQQSSVEDWFARAVLHVTDVEASIHFYVYRLGFTSPWRYEEDGRVRVAQVERKGFALILSDQWPQKVGKGLVFISMNLDPETQIAQLDALRAEFEAKGARVKEGSWGYRLLVVDDPDGNQLFFNYPSDTASSQTVRRGVEVI